MPDVVEIVALLTALTAAITIHEFSHAAAAYALGDETARKAGRLTLNPLSHLDPLGTVLLLVVIFTGVPGIGWGKPVPFQPWALKGGRRGMALVSAAGPASNVLLAVTSESFLRYAVATNIPMPDPVALLLSTLVVVNTTLAAFNLIPLPPLDGFGVAVGLLPGRAARPLANIERFGPGILLLLIFAPSIIRIDPLGLILSPLSNIVSTVVKGASRAIATILGG